jgi:hypothetical protein
MRNSKRYDDSYNEDINSLMVEKVGLLARLMPNQSSKQYMVLAFSGFIWICMCAVSFIAIFVIFKTPYYKYYNQSAPVIIPEGNVTAMDDEEYLLQQRKNSNNAQPALQIPEDFIEQNTGVNTQNNQRSLPKNNKLAVQVPIPEQKPVERSYQNKEDTDITKLLKQEPVKEEPKVAVTTPAQPPASQAKKDLPKPKVTPPSSTQKDVNVNLNTAKANKQEEAPVSAVPQDKKAGTSPYLALNNKPVVWVVNVYSTRNKEVLPEKLQQIKGSSSIFATASAYFTEFMSDGRKNYRISFAKDGGFATQADASNFCAELRKSKIDCFVSSIDGGLLQTYRAN